MKNEREFELVGEVTISVHTNVRAKSLKEAIKIAEGRALTSIKNTWEDDPDEEWCTSGELDGTVTIIEVDGEEYENV